MVVTLNPFKLPASSSGDSSSTITYEVKEPDGKGPYAWLINVDVDTTTPSITISTDNENLTGIYDLVLYGTYEGI